MAVLCTERCGTAERNARQNCCRRVKVVPAHHGFLMQGADPVHLVYLPMFNVGSHRQQLIVSAQLPAGIMADYVKLRADSAALITLHTAHKELLSEILERGEFEAVIDLGLPLAHGCVFN